MSPLPGLLQHQGAFRTGLPRILRATSAPTDVVDDLELSRTDRNPCFRDGKQSSIGRMHTPRYVPSAFTAWLAAGSIDRLFETLDVFSQRDLTVIQSRIAKGKTRESLLLARCLRGKGSHVCTASACVQRGSDHPIRRFCGDSSSGGCNNLRGTSIGI